MNNVDGKCQFLHFRQLLFSSLTSYPADIAYLTRLIKRLATTRGPKSCDKEKLSIPLEAHDKAPSSEIFLFSGKKLKGL